MQYTVVRRFMAVVEETAKIEAASPDEAIQKAQDFDYGDDLEPEYVEWNYDFWEDGQDFDYRVSERG